MKKIITVPFILIFILIAFIFVKSKLNEYDIKNHPENIIGKENFNTLFDLCKADIDTSIYPKNAKELSRYNIKDKDKYPLYKDLNSEKSKLYLKQIKLFGLLGDKISEVNNKSFETLFLTEKENNAAYLYYDYNGDLMMIKKGYNPHQYVFVNCRYDKDGKLLESEYSDEDNIISVFNSNKQFMYSHFVNHFLEYISNDYAFHIIK